MPPKRGALDAHGWFKKADQFHYTSLFLGQQPLPMQSIYARPHIVLKAFAAEAYLKALIKLEGKDPPQIHDLLELFDELSLESKKLIQRWWNKECLPQLDQLRKQKPPGYKPPKTLRGALNEAADAFLDWRYHGENPVGLGFSIMAFPLMVRRRILELEPGWAHKEPHPLAWLNG